MSNQALAALKAFDNGNTSIIDEQIVKKQITISSVVNAINYLEIEISNGCTTSVKVLAHLLSCSPDDVSGDGGWLDELRNDQLHKAYDSLNTGWVYVLANKYIPELLKIGYTSQCVKERARQISSTTGVPVAYKTLFSFKTIHCKDVESLVHKKLDKYRVNESREFFKCSAGMAAKACQSAVRSIHHKYGLSEEGKALRGTDYFPDQDYAIYISERFDKDPEDFFAEKQQIEGPF
jgi:hypothetical protein